MELIDEPAAQDTLFAAIEKIPAVKAKADWCIRWVTACDVGFPVRLIAFAVVEGVFFSSSFAALFWLRHRNLMPGLTYSNELIARDEGMHVRFAAQLYRELLRSGENVPPIEAMVREAVELELAFFNGAFFIM